MKKLYDLELLEALSLEFGPTGCEDKVANLILSQIEGDCDEYSIDKMGNVVALVRGGGEGYDREKPKKLMLSAHMDEVGFMVVDIDESGYVKFDTLGGIDPRVLCGRNIVLGNEVNSVRGVIASKAIHHQTREERKKITPTDKLYMDIGAACREETEKYVNVGDFGTFDTEFTLFGKDGRLMACKALDDRLGCAVLIEAMRSQTSGTLPFDVYYSFSVREEVGLSGARVVANRLAPDFAIVIETTAIADIDGVADHSKVAKVGEGGVISLLDRSTIYDRGMIEYALDTAKENAIKAQIKKYVSGGNDAKHIHLSGKGVRALALSAPTRYLHSPLCVASVEDYRSMTALVKKMLSAKLLEIKKY